MPSILRSCSNNLLSFIGKCAHVKECNPFSTIKRQWGFSYFLTKKRINMASADVGFMFIAYNLSRIGNILTHNQLKEYLRILVLLFLSKTAFPRLQNSFFRTTFSQVSDWDRKFSGSLVPA